MCFCPKKRAHVCKFSLNLHHIVALINWVGSTKRIDAFLAIWRQATSTVNVSSTSQKRGEATAASLEP